jgi:hypothetical protein
VTDISVLFLIILISHSVVAYHSLQQIDTEFKRAKMPGEVIDRPNPAPLDSHLPDGALDLAYKPPKKQLDKKIAQSLNDFQHSACYIAGCKPDEPRLRVWRTKLTSRSSHDLP